MTNGTNLPQAKEQAQTQDEMNQTLVTFTVTIGELNGLFGAINASAFQAVMQPLAQDVNNQITARKLPPQQTQQEALAMPVAITLKLGDVNSMFSVVNSTGFATILKPVLDKITAEVQMFVTTLNQPQPQESMMPQFPNISPLQPPDFGTQ